MMSAANIHYDMDGRNQGIANGGIGIIHRLSKKTGLVAEIDRRLELPRIRPCSQCRLNILAGGQCLQDLELLRNDKAWLAALNAKIIPDPTTVGDFLRRFEEKDVIELMEIKNTVRKKIWRLQSKPFRNEAVINVDGTISPTCGECKEGMDMSYNGQWSYHPLVVSLAPIRASRFTLSIVWATRLRIWTWLPG